MAADLIYSRLIYLTQHIGHYMEGKHSSHKLSKRKFSGVNMRDD